MSLLNDIARCRGVGSEADGWMDGCETCLRRTATQGSYYIDPPLIIVFECESLMEPEKPLIP